MVMVLFYRVIIRFLISCVCEAFCLYGFNFIDSGVIYCRSIIVIRFVGDIDNDVVFVIFNIIFNVKKLLSLLRVFVMFVTCLRVNVKDDVIVRYGNMLN